MHGRYRIGKRILFILISLYCMYYTNAKVYAQQTTTPTPATGSVDNQAIETKIKELQAQLDATRNKRRTLADEIAHFESQQYIISLKIEDTKRKITTAQQEADLLEGRIDNLDANLDTYIKAFMQSAYNNYKHRPLTIFDYLLMDEHIENILQSIKYHNLAQNTSQQLLLQTQETKANYAEQKEKRDQKRAILADLNNELTAQQQESAQKETLKRTLLADTQNDEARYQKLITEAEAQLKNFSKFTVNQGGASILSGQTSCDDWGCYYNQRDDQWGSNSLNGTGYTLASDGCLVTSMAMIYTHLGYRNVTPQTINSDPFNFASYYPAFLKKTISAGGVSTSRIYTTLDAELSQGRPVIVGISYDGGPLPDHFLVIVSGSNGDYLMRDPFTPNGKNISFTSKYPISSIREIEKVVIN